MKLFHVGLPLTATTSLQKHFFCQIEGLQYLGRESDVFQEVARPLTSFDQCYLDINQMKKMVGDKGDFILSWERIVGDIQDNFIDHTSNAYLLSKIAPGSKILLTIRKQDNWILSAYQQALRRGCIQSFKEFINYNGKDFDNYGKYNPRYRNLGSVRQFNIHSLNYYKFYQTYCKYFGKENVLVAPFETIINDWVEFKKIFSDFTGYSLLHKNTPGRSRGSNKKYRSRSAKMACWINKFACTPENPLGFIPIKKKPSVGIKKFNIRSLHDAFSGLGGKDLLSDEISKAIMEKYKCSNEKLNDNIEIDLKKYCYL